MEEVLWSAGFHPLMKISYDWTPAYPYALLGYQMFAFLFAWTDANWLPRRKAKMFRFTPQPVSSASIYWWAGKDGFATRGCVLDPQLEQWWDDNFLRSQCTVAEWTFWSSRIP